MLVNTTAGNVIVGMIQVAGLNRPSQRPETWTFRNDVLVANPVDRMLERPTYVYVPYSVGLLQAYVQRHATVPQRYQFLQPLYKPVPVAEAVADLQGADVVGCSAYVWNIGLSLAIAKALKEQQPDTLIVFGGPQVPDHAETFLRDNPFIDVVCHGEGEQIFLSLLEAYPEREWSHIPAISYLRPDGTFVTQPKTKRLADLSLIPSPYVEGIFDELLRAHPEHEWLITCETNRGCPFSCSYCDWGSATASKVYRFGMDRVKAEIDWFASHKLKHIFICDANFGILPRDVEIAEYLVETYKKHRIYPQVVTQNTKNATDRSYQINKTLSQIATNGVTLALQSLDSQVLRNIKRDNIALESFNELQKRYIHDNIDTYTDVIIGLPGETYDSFADGIASILANGQHNRLAMYNCSILPNAEMGNPEYQRRFGIISTPVPIINEHESVVGTTESDVQERMEMVIATDSLPPAAWLKTKVFAWMTELLHYDRLLQLPLVVLHEQYQVSYRHLIEAFTTVDAQRFPVCAEISAWFMVQAEASRAGQPDYVPGHDLLHIWWPVHQYALIRIVTENKLERFYQEATVILTEVLQQQDIVLDQQLLNEAILLNQHLLCVPFQFSNLNLSLSFNLWEFYQSVIQGIPIVLERQAHQYQIDRTSRIWLALGSWCADLIGRHYQRRTYLYPVSVCPPARDMTEERASSVNGYVAI